MFYLICLYVASFICSACKLVAKLYTKLSTYTAQESNRKNVCNLCADIITISVMYISYSTCTQ